jgi:hypothetical protein
VKQVERPDVERAAREVDARGRRRFDEHEGMLSHLSGQL